MAVSLFNFFPMTLSRWLQSHKNLAGNALRAAVMLGVLAGLLLVGQAWLLAKVVNAVIFEKTSLAEVMPWLWPMLGLFLLRALLAWASEQIAYRAAIHIKLSLREQLYAKLQRLGPLWLRNQQSGELANTLTDGVEALEGYYARFLPAISLTVLVPLALLVFVLPSDWVSAVVMLVTAPLIPVFMILVGKGTERLNQKQWKVLARMSARFLDSIQGLTTLKLFNASRREAQVVETLSDQYRESTMSVLRVAFLSSVVLEFFATVSIAVVAVLIGFRLMWGELDFYHGFFVLLLAPEFYLPLRNMGAQYHARMEAIGAAERMQEIMRAPVPEAPAEVQAAICDTASIEFVGVEFAYEEGRAALQGFDLAIKSGERIALVGASGAGKTTVLNMLLGFIRPQQGQLKINGRDILEFDPESWRRCLAYVPQNPRLFHGTVADNIRLARKDADMDQTQLAAQRARAHDFIMALARGYETEVGEGGQNLSGGQIQRLALARAFLRDAPLLLMDEPTASLDAENEASVETAIAELAEGRTVIVVAHRLATVRQADRVVVMENGRVAEQGSHADLSVSGRVYPRWLQDVESDA